MSSRNPFVFNNAVQWLTLGATIITWPLISFGAIVRLKGAGLACPDWPLCYGQIIPPSGFEIALEVGHRFIATLLGLCLIGLTVIVFRQERYAHYRLPAAMILAITCLQGVLGGLTVIQQLWPPVVVMHLIGGNLLLSMLVYLSWCVFHESRSPFLFLPTRWRSQTRILFTILMIVFIILISGGANSSTYSGYACDAFPGCHHDHEGAEEIRNEKALAALPPEVQAGFWPLFQNEWIHMGHRFIAMAGGGLIIYLALLLFQRKNASDRWFLILLVVLILLEVTVGILNAIYRVPVPISTFHTAIASTIVALVSYLLAKDVHQIIEDPDER